MKKCTFVFDERQMSEEMGDAVLKSSLTVKWSRLNENVNVIVYLDDIPLVALERTLDLNHKEEIVRYSRETGCQKVLVYEGDIEDEHIAVQAISKGLSIVRARTTQEFVRVLEGVRDALHTEQ